MNCTSLESITIPKDVQKIGCGAFSGCERLAEISLPDTIAEIDEEAFENTNWYDDFEGDLVILG